jgi:hypothetical protein
MAQCSAENVEGARCRNFARQGSAFCHRHADRFDLPKLLGTGIGALAGNAILPGIGGRVLGGAAGNFLTGLLRDTVTGRKKAFVSFDFDSDRGLKDLFVGQARLEETPFDIIDYSLKEAAPERNWQDKARTAIRRSDVVLILLGEQTYRAPGVLLEVAMAREEQKQMFQVIGYRDRVCPSVNGGGRRLAWSWPNLKRVLS